MHKQDIRR